MKSTTGYILADFADILAYAVFTQITADEVLNWVYTIILIVSVIFGIVMKFISALQDRKITKQEEEEIKKTMEQGLQEIKDEIEKESHK